ncbi:MAG: DUF899 family protein [Deltaproteobacteria bacterium]|nr:DUF899 family protein [Deltaproteobacteria bacterium]
MDKKILKLERAIANQKKKLARLRAKTAEEFADYDLVSRGGRTVKLSQLFGKKKELILVHNMGTGCPYCTMWADGFNGLLPHLEDRAAFAVESPDRPATQKEFAARRKWNFTMVSSQGTGFRKKSGFQTREGSPMPGVSVFVKKAGGRIFRVSSSYFGPGDNYCPTWDLFDLLPGGPGGWTAKFKY